MSEDNGNDQPYETTETNTYIYRNFSRFQYSIPPYIFGEMMGLSPQRRRAYLLQQRYRTALGFDYAILEVFKKTAYWVIVVTIIKILWESFLYEYKIITCLILAITLVLFAVFRWQQRANTKTIKEEIFYQSTSDLAAFIFSMLVSFSGSVHTFITF